MARSGASSIRALIASSVAPAVAARLPAPRPGLERCGFNLISNSAELGPHAKTGHDAAGDVRCFGKIVCSVGRDLRENSAFTLVRDPQESPRRKVSPSPKLKQALGSRDADRAAGARRAVNQTQFRAAQRYRGS